MNIEKLPFCNNTNLSYFNHIYKDNLTFLELVLSIIKKLNETIEITNSNNDFINSLDNTIDNLKSQIDSLNSDLSSFKLSVNNTIETRFQNIKSEIISLLNDYQIIFNNSISKLKSDFEQQIANISLGNILAYDPTSGKFVNINTALQNIYDNLRQNSITCHAFDDLQLTATVFDNKNISAFDFDINGYEVLTTSI